MRFHFPASITPILENRIFSIILAPFFPLNEAKISNQFPVMKTLTEIFQIFCAISVHKKTPKNTQAKVFEKIALWQHALMLIHSGEKFFCCEECNYKCTAARYLKKHKRIHTGEKPHACKECNYSCTFYGSLKNHTRKHSANQKQMTWWCL